jgi:uncharacterized protein (DUF302 family)
VSCCGRRVEHTYFKRFGSFETRKEAMSTQSFTQATDNGIVTVRTHRTVEEAADKLAALIEAKGITLFARINFAADAQHAGLAMNPSQLLVFGNPRAGTPLMQAVPTAALDLPLKVLVWQDDDGHVSLSYNAASYVQARYGAPVELMKPLEAVAGLVQAAAAD